MVGVFGVAQILPNRAVIAHRGVETRFAVGILQRHVGGQWLVFSAAIVACSGKSFEAFSTVPAVQLAVFARTVGSVVHIIGVYHLLGKAMCVPSAKVARHGMACKRHHAVVYACGILVYTREDKFGIVFRSNVSVE